MDIEVPSRAIIWWKELELVLCDTGQVFESSGSPTHQDEMAKQELVGRHMRTYIEMHMLV